MAMIEVNEATLWNFLECCLEDEACYICPANGINCHPKDCSGFMLEKCIARAIEALQKPSGC